MTGWQEGQLQELLAIHTGEEFFKAIASIARDLGFDHCAYGVRAPVPVSHPKTWIINNYPIHWQEKYRLNGYLTVDPSVLHCSRSPFPVLWSDELFSSTRTMWEEANAFGLRVGWAVACRGADGFAGMVTLARECEPLSDVELRDKGLQMVWLSQVTHMGMLQRLSASNALETRTALSPREIDVLRWTADGKTSGEISMILNIAERTVNFHVTNAMTKLRVTNKTAAAVHAAMMGLFN